MNFSIITLGCKVNQYESQVMINSMLNSGFGFEKDYRIANIVIVNSCTVTAVSDSKVFKLLRRVKRENPSSVTVLTGCLPQAFPNDIKNCSAADIITGNKCRGDLLPLINEYLKSGKQIIKITPHMNDTQFENMRVSSFNERTRALVKIEDGCNRFCSYCIIPYARGRVRSKPIDKLRTELQILAQNGYREIVLVGINLTAYGSDLRNLNLADAIETACSIDGIERVRLGSLEPDQMDADIVERLAVQKKLCPQFHLSLQSGCDQTLKRMNRHYNTDEYMEIVNKIRANFENCAITTDVMVGFPGEDEDEFRQSLKFVKRVGFSKVHTFAYSQRPGTVASSAENQVNKADKDRRSKIVISETDKMHQNFLNMQLGRCESVLFETRTKSGLFEGYTMNYTKVYLRTDEDISNKIIHVKLIELLADGCLGVEF